MSRKITGQSHIIHLHGQVPGESPASDNPLQLGMGGEDILINIPFENVINGIVHSNFISR